MRALKVALAVAFGAASVAHAQVKPAWYPPGLRGGIYGAAGAAPVAPCSQQYGGVSPGICMDFVNNSFTNTLTTDTGSKSAAGVTCTGSQLEEFTGTLPSGNILVIVDATYPASTGTTAVALYPATSHIPYALVVGGGGGTPIFNGGSNATTARTGSVKISGYWNGSTWSSSAGGDTPTSAGSTAPTVGSEAIDICNFGGSNPLTTAFRSLRYYFLGATTLSTAQVQAAAT